MPGPYPRPAGTDFLDTPGLTGPFVIDALADGLDALDAAVASILSGLTIVVANLQTASYALVLGDAGKVVEMNLASANTLTVPLNATVGFPVGTVIEVCQIGAGQTTLTPATGAVNLRSRGALLKLAGQWASASLRKRGTDEWVVAGDLIA